MDRSGERPTLVELRESGGLTATRAGLRPGRTGCGNAQPRGVRSPPVRRQRNPEGSSGVALNEVTAALVGQPTRRELAKPARRHVVRPVNGEGMSLAIYRSVPRT